MVELESVELESVELKSVELGLTVAEAQCGYVQLVKVESQAPTVQRCAAKAVVLCQLSMHL